MNSVKQPLSILFTLIITIGTNAVFADMPKFTNMRYEEDWSSFDKTSDKAMFPSIKHVTLPANENIWASFGGQAQTRHEFWSGFGFGASNPDDDDYNLQRFRLHGDFHLGSNVRIFLEGIVASSTDRELSGTRRAGDRDGGDFMNAFIEFQTDAAPNKGHKLRIGRQEINYGKQRIISAANWSNTRRNFDGIKGIFHLNDWRLDAFWTRPVTKLKYEINESNDDQEFFGVIAVGKTSYIPGNVELYALGLDRSSRTFNGISGQEERYSIGTRIWGPITDTFAYYEFEGHYQFGDHGTADIDAFMLTGELGYKPDWGPSELNLWLAADYASGDDSAGDGDSETFDPLFPTGHGHLGYTDQLGRFNIIDFRPGFSFKGPVGTSVKFDFHNFWRANTNDAVYNTGGGVRIAATATNESYIGSEVDITLKKKFTSNIAGMLVYGHFFTGDVIEDGIVNDEDVDVIYALLNFTF